MTMRHLFEDIHAEPLPEFHHALLVTGGAKVSPFTGEGKQVFMPAVFAFHPGKAVDQIATVEITANHLFDIRPPEAVLP